MWVGLKTLFFLLSFFLLADSAAPASTLPPELKAYDFAQAYYIEDGGLVIVPYNYGFSCPRYVETPEGLRVMPGGTFSQYDPQHQVDQEFHFVRLSADGSQAFLHERVYACHAVTAPNGQPAHVRDRLVGTNHFYLSQFRDLEWFDFVFGNIQMHPGLAEWQSKNWRYLDRQGAF
jgi:hypothetical protein